MFSQLDFHPNFSFTIHLHICFTFHAFNVDIYDKDDDNDDDDDDDDDGNDDDDDDLMMILMRRHNKVFLFDFSSRALGWKIVTD